jgi:hypothetical protein
VKAEILYIVDCPNWIPARRQLERLLSELGVRCPVAEVEVTDRAAAERLQFGGSPTIRIDGEDVEAGQPGSPALACRTYERDGRFAGIPSDDLVRGAIRRAFGLRNQP